MSDAEAFSKNGKHPRHSAQRRDTAYNLFIHGELTDAPLWKACRNRDGQYNGIGTGPGFDTELRGGTAGIANR